MEQDKGYIKVNRKVMDNWLWFYEPFTRAMAWLDLLLIAQYKDGFFHSKKGRIDYKRGDCTMSISDLADRWQWSRGKVRNFLDVLEEQDMIRRQVVKKTYSIITVLNYEKYQGNEKATMHRKNKKNDDDFDYDKARAFLMGDDDE